MTVQLAPAGNAAKPVVANPLASKVILLDPGVAVSVVLKPAFALTQSVEALAGSAITIPSGRRSVKSIVPMPVGLSELSIV